jgi:maleylpyruvate isomerase
MTSTQDQARAELRARQGAGARYDADTAPHENLLLARRGTAYFARKLNELSDVDLDGPSAVEGTSRRKIIAQMSLEARQLALALKALHAPLIADELEWRPDVALATTLPDRALRHLFEHAVKHLDVEWRDLPADLWAAAVVFDGFTGTTRETAFWRAKKIWQASLDLRNGARRVDVPKELVIE